MDGIPDFIPINELSDERLRELHFYKELMSADERRGRYQLPSVAEDNRGTLKSPEAPAPEQNRLSSAGGRGGELYHGLHYIV